VGGGGPARLRPAPDCGSPATRPGPRGRFPHTDDGNGQEAAGTLGTCKSERARSFRTLSFPRRPVPSAATPAPPPRQVPAPPSASSPPPPRQPSAAAPTVPRPDLPRERGAAPDAAPAQSSRSATAEQKDRRARSRRGKSPSSHPRLTLSQWQREGTAAQPIRGRLEWAGRRDSWEVEAVCRALASLAVCFALAT
jgi:hypothetical protein